MSDTPLPPRPDEEWDDLLRRLRQQSAASPQPFFYARVHARLLASAGRASSPFYWLPHWLRRSAYATLVGALVLAVSGDGAATTHGSRSAGYPAREAAR